MDTHSAPGTVPSLKNLKLLPDLTPSMESPIPKFSRATIETQIQTDDGEVYGIVYYKDAQTKEIVYLPLSLQPIDDQDALLLSSQTPFFNTEKPSMKIEERDYLLFSLAIALLTDSDPIFTLVDKTFNKKQSKFPALIIPENYKVNVAVVGKAIGGKTTFTQRIRNLRIPGIKTVDIDPAQTLTIRTDAQIAGNPSFHTIRGARTPETERFDINAIKATIRKLKPNANERIVIADNGGHNETPRDITPTALMALASELIILTTPPEFTSERIIQMLLRNPGLALFRFKNAINLPQDTEADIQSTVDILKSDKLQQFATHQRLQFALAILKMVNDPWYQLQILGALRLAVPQIIEKHIRGLEPQLRQDLAKIARLQFHIPAEDIYILHPKE